MIIDNNVYAKWKPDIRKTSYCKFIKRLCFAFVSTSRFVRACIHRKIELLERQKHSSFPQIYRISFHNRLLRTPYHPRNTLTPSILFIKKKKKKKKEGKQLAREDSCEYGCYNIEREREKDRKRDKSEMREIKQTKSYMSHELSDDAVPFPGFRVFRAVLPVRYQLQSVWEADLPRHRLQ